MRDVVAAFVAVLLVLVAAWLLFGFAAWVVYKVVV